ncbi:hypothetical protein [Exiguobacterium flavidum]|uniref:hypothetical protein n=1 Tax=Exiguobacterium flavidum TaxID=2184695 RepID=UPI000DF7CF4D|nr:hypothetical protein [Exiguobacterium flavidum]
MTKRTSTWIAVAIVAMAMLLAYNFYLLNQTQSAKEEKAQTVKPFYTMTRLQYEEKKLSTTRDELEARTYEVIYDGDGRFRTEVIDGPNEGTMAIWDGKTFREYDENGKLVSETKSAESVSAPRPFLSRGFNEQIMRFIDQGDFGQVEGEAKLAGVATEVYIKREPSSTVPDEWIEKYPSIFSEEGNEEQATYYVAADRSKVLGAESRNNGKLFYSVKMKKIETLEEFDQEWLEAKQ